MRKVTSTVLAAGTAAAVITGIAACGGPGGYSGAPYVIDKIYCPGDVFATCVVMSDGDVVGPVGNGILDAILYGMVLSPRGSGYYFTRPPGNVTVHQITHVSNSTTYVDRRPVSPSAEAAREKSGDTYDAGGKDYPQSPKYKARQRAQLAEPHDSIPSGQARRQAPPKRAKQAAPPRSRSKR